MDVGAVAMSDDWYDDELRSVGIAVDPIYGPDRVATRFYERAKAAEATLAGLRAALQRIVDWSDCQCEHDTGDCCAHVADSDFHCPGCIASQTLTEAPRPAQEKP